MTEYYFTEDPNAEHAERTWDATILKNIFTFTSDSGVFSKNNVDFGTKTLLEAISFQTSDHKILDVGCGYGPIGIVIAKLHQDFVVHMTDVNHRSLGLAERNAKSNHVDQQTKVFESNVYEQVQDQDYTSIISNPPVRAGKKIVDQIISEAKDHLVDGGQLLIVLQKKQGAPSAKKLMNETYGNAEVIKKNKGYYILRSVK
ncbi:class I SAM-dependent methyltransferase [Pediococcus argentinicus]|uniref:16S RNA methylase n=1 Tax=Pediococcus argentinicus TaxID=480391 RepID=A0A0R2NPI2_9LACO|nr:class I SAM-dependent methyltransferase [Pediococcus argentinicus]KRO25779.1 16S RNA methylase [Pediococcus argentinicus]NKZ21945.1 class I SAM-dependent methyltransferase [Pediococcus argentinicus]GEP19114.1 16S RNA G1207 methylase RsmC [Pediococcus argentinicus]